MTVEPVTLQIGGRPVALTRSDRLIALRAKPGGEPAVAHALENVLGPAGRNAELGDALGGFRIVELASMPTEKADRQLDLLRAEPEVQTGTHVFHFGTDSEVPVVPTGELYVVFKADATSDQRQALIDKNALRIIEGRGADTVILRTTPASRNPVTTAAALQQEPAIVIAEPSLASPIQRRGLTLPADRLLTEQWHLRNVGQHNGATLGGIAGADARVVDAWQALGSLGHPELIVAVIDDGFDPDHPDLAAKMVAPRDFTRRNNAPWPGPDDWHGTACAGVAVAAAGSGAVIGAAPAAKLMPVRWGEYLDDSQVEAWFDYVTAKGASVVSCSWGAKARHFSLTQRMKDAIARCARDGRGGKGCIVVFAAGNAAHDIDDPDGGTLDGFAIHPDVIAVAASNSRDQRAEYSNFGDAIWICAPSNSTSGWSVLTADVTDDAHGSRGYQVGDYTWGFGGTSSACPLVAGVAALVLSANPELTAREVKGLLARTARRIGREDDYQNGRSRLLGHGCVDAGAAVRAAIAMRDAV